MASSEKTAPNINRRHFIAGLLAASFALQADSTFGARAQAPLGGVDLLPASGRPTSMVVLLHGFGGNGESMRYVAAAWAKILPNTVFVMPDAPEQCRDNENPLSRQWYASRALDPDAATRVAQIRRIEPMLNDYIDAKLAQYGLRDRDLAIAGISQGAMMTLQAAVRRRHPCAAVVAYSGMLVDAEGLREDHIVRMPIFAAHGRQDNVVPYTHLAELQRDFTQAGFKVETASYDIAHDVNAEELRRGADFIRQNLQAAKPAPWLARVFA